MSDEDTLARAAAKVRRSMEDSRQTYCQVRFFRLRDQFGFRLWSARRKELVAKALAEQGITSRPPLTEVSLDDWVMLTLTHLQSPGDGLPDHP